MKRDKLTKISIILIALIIILSSIAYAKPFTEAFRGGLLQINDFFTSQQYKTYSQAIDFFFFGMLFIAIYMMGARYAFKEVKRPEQVIVILLGLMTAFLLVLGGFSATILIPYVQYLLYALVFIMWWLLLKGIKNKFWRFVLALLLTLLTIGAFQWLFGSLTTPDTQGFFSSLGGAFKGIQFPELPGWPGVPDYLSNLFGPVSAPVTGPTTLPPTITPTEEKKSPGWLPGGYSAWHLLWILPLLLVLMYGGLRIWRRVRRPRAPPTKETAIDKIIKKIEEIIKNKKESIDKINAIKRNKDSIIEASDKRIIILARLAQRDLANLFTDEGRAIIEQEEAAFKEFVQEELKLVSELKNLTKIEKDFFTELHDWLKSLLEIEKIKITEFVNGIKELLEGEPNASEIEKIGIYRLITLYYNFEKHEYILGVELAELFEESKIEELVRGKFNSVKHDENKLAAYKQWEEETLGILTGKVMEQIEKLEKLKETLTKIQATRPTKPQPTVHPVWPEPTDDKDPIPPQPVFPLKPVIPPPPKPRPTRHKKVYIDLSPQFLPIKNQQRTNACVAFAGSSIPEYLLNVASNNVDLKHELSQLFMYYYIRTHKTLDEGSFISEVPLTLTREGICFEPLWTWKPVNPATTIPLKLADPPSAEATSDALLKTISITKTLDPADPDSWVDELLKNNPILIAMRTYQCFRDAGNRREYFYGAVTGTYVGGHALVIVGFKTDFPNPSDPKVGIPAFKVRNSWGSQWGENGYIWVPHNLLPTLMLQKPIVIGDLGKEKKTKKQNAHTLILTPTNSTPDAPIVIIGDYHDAYEDQNKWVKIGKEEESENKFNEIVLRDTTLNEKLQAMIIFFKYKEAEKKTEIDRFKIISEKNSQVSIKINGKEIPSKNGIKSAWILNSVEKLQINEYTFDVKVGPKEQEILPPEQYKQRFADKYLKLKKELKTFARSLLTYLKNLKIEEFEEARKLLSDMRHKEIISDDLNKFLVDLQHEIEHKNLTEAIELLNILKRNYEAWITGAKNRKAASQLLGFFEAGLEVVNELILKYSKISVQITSHDNENIYYTIHDPQKKYEKYQVAVFVTEKGKKKYEEIASGEDFEPNTPAPYKVSLPSEELPANVYDFIIRAIPMQEGQLVKRQGFNATITIPVIKIINPVKDEKLYIGQSILELMSEPPNSRGANAKLKDYDKVLSYEWVMFQGDKEPFVVHDRWYGEHSKNTIPYYFEPGPAKLSLIVKDEGNIISRDDIDVLLEKGGMPVIGHVRILSVNGKHIYEIKPGTAIPQKTTKLEIKYGQGIEAAGDIRVFIKMKCTWVLFDGATRQQLLKIQWRSYPEGRIVRIKPLNPGRYMLGFVAATDVSNEQTYLKDYVEIEIVPESYLRSKYVKVGYDDENDEPAKKTVEQELADDNAAEERKKIKFRGQPEF